MKSLTDYQFLAGPQQKALACCLSFPFPLRLAVTASCRRWNGEAPGVPPAEGGYTSAWNWSEKGSSGCCSAVNYLWELGLIIVGLNCFISAF